MSATTRKPLEHRHRAVTIIGLTLAVFSLAVTMGALGDPIEIRAPAGFAFLGLVITVTLTVIFDLIAEGDRCGAPKIDGS